MSKAVGLADHEGIESVIRVQSSRAIPRRSVFRVFVLGRNRRGRGRGGASLCAVWKAVRSASRACSEDESPAHPQGRAPRNPVPDAARCSTRKLGSQRGLTAGGLGVGSCAGIARRLIGNLASCGNCRFDGCGLFRLINVLTWAFNGNHCLVHIEKRGGGGLNASCSAARKGAVICSSNTARVSLLGTSMMRREDPIRPWGRARFTNPRWRAVTFGSLLRIDSRCAHRAWK